MPKLNQTANQILWSQHWADTKIDRTPDITTGDKKKYILDMFPFPSGAGLHVGHPRGYLATDALSRYYRHQGFKVLHPMGWDAFGLPTEQHAIKTGIQPYINTKNNIDTFKKQLKSLGLSYDWDREINTTDPNYYRWTQWIFLQLFDKGLAYESETPVNWCPQLGTILSNEEIVNGLSERGSHPVFKIPIKQWLLRITAYSERLIKDLDTLPQWPNKIRTMQENWIGKSTGHEVDFEVDGNVSMNNYLFLHDWKGNSSSGFFPALKALLESKGATVTSLELPNSDNPTEFDQVDFVSANYIFNENSIIVGHGLGALVGFKILQKIQGRIKKFISVGGYVDTFWKKELPFVQKFNFNLDFTSIKKNCGTFLVINDAQDNLVKETQAKFLASKLDTLVCTVKAQENHFEGNLEPVLIQNLFPKIKVYTTRVDTIAGATFLVIAPEHSIVNQITKSEFSFDVENYIELAKTKSEMERTELTKDKTGVFTGSFATNPLTGIELPIFVADYVMTSYGKGAIMAVPAHDQRDWDFAKKYKLNIIPTILPKDQNLKTQVLNNEVCFTGEGLTADIKTDTENFEGLAKAEAIEAIGTYLSKLGIASPKTNYKLRDWVFSRQRYWGEPIPIVFEVDSEGNRISGAIALDNSELPLLLPEVSDFNLVKPDPNAQKPDASLAKFRDWVEVTGYYLPNGKVKIIKDGEQVVEGLETHTFHRETNTMPNWAGSSWYYLRFMDPDNNKSFCDTEKLWGPVDIYVGGAEHAVLHLLYARFWHKVLYDLGLVTTVEPFTKLVNQGLIMAEGGVKMSKSLDNVVNPDDIIKEYGADSLRLFEYFIGPFEQSVSWSTSSISGVKRFLDRFYNLLDKVKNEHNPEADFALNSLIQSVTKDIEDYKFNTIVSEYMKFVNTSDKFEFIGSEQLKKLVICLSPFAPFTAEQMWYKLAQNQNQNFLGVQTLNQIANETFDNQIKKIEENQNQTEVFDILKQPISKVCDTEQLKEKGFLDTIKDFFGGKEKTQSNTATVDSSFQSSKILRDTLPVESTDNSNQDQVIKKPETNPTSKPELEKEHLSLANYESVHLQPWPSFDPSKLVVNEITMGVQINGKVRTEITLSPTANEDEVKAKVWALETIIKHIEGKEIKKFIYIPGRIINIVIG